MKAERAMTNEEQKLREFAEKLFPYGGAFSAGVIDVQRNRCMQLLTALISEHYYPKEFVEWLFGHSLVWDEKTMTWFTQIERAFNYWKENER